MIHYVQGNLLDSKAEALVNTVNTIGVMGKGVALQFKQQFPENAKVYIKASKEGTIDIGKLLVTKDTSLHTGEKIIINFPTKTDWRKPSEYSYIEKGLQDLLSVIKEQGINSIALPPLGAGNGGLHWVKVKQILEHYLSSLSNAAIFRAKKLEVCL
jgi:O-acetyl-ADP-ribose deacetylase (regulator of RNase III)